MYEAKDLDRVFRAEKGRLWALCYRLTGSACEAEDLVQDAFVRAMERPPRDANAGFTGWLVRVTTNLALDALRRRKSRVYAGEWLPGAVETDLAGSGGPWHAEGEATDPEGRYGLLESASFAFLIALEALDARQRAVLVLRDVLDYSAREVAAFLDLTEENVRVIHHRARRAMRAYDANRCIPTPQLAQTTRAALERFMECLARQDARGIEELLAEDVRTVTDAGGIYTALREPLVGRDRVARLYLVAAQHRARAVPTVELRSVNGLPAALVQLAEPARRQAPRALLRCELGEGDRITVVHSILAPAKLQMLRFPDEG